MSKQNNILGLLGEKIAITYLQKEGYFIMGKNFRTKYGEIDIIGKKENIIYFFEVKTRKSTAKGKPYESVTQKKLYHLYKACNIYILQNNLKKAKLSLQVISIELGENNIANSIELYPII